jgi:hypothetical protein
VTRFFESGFIALIPIPDLRKGRHRAAPPVLVLESALRSCPHVALSSAQAIVIVALYANSGKPLICQPACRAASRAFRRCSRAVSSPCLGWRVVRPYGASPEFSISHYMTVSAMSPGGGVGGRRSLTFRALSTRRASGQPPATPQRFAWPCTRNVT